MRSSMSVCVKYHLSDIVHSVFEIINNKKMQYRIILYNSRHLPPILIHTLYTLITPPKSLIKHHTSLMKKFTSTIMTSFLLLVLVNISPTLNTSWNKVIIVGWTLLWYWVECYLLAIGGLDELDWLATVGAVLVEFPPSAGALSAAEFMAAVEDGVVVVKLV